ncbi:nucleotidyltransferase family protein [Lagierella sp.]|uniref:tRNA(Met) cytidine acetate ligase n=1 Tax=Lagierella sp. TaxID=2849657 RepID=UPI002638D6BB|nr:nucleotidyltransferase family protein [Lagierella sp.]
MKNIAIISEYNPFHNGHLHQIQEVKKKHPDSTIITIMSGNFVQRGEPAILNKYERCKNAISAGLDLALQIPTIYSLQSAENFALGSIKILEELKVVDYLSFGIESKNFDMLYKIAESQIKNGSLLKDKTSKLMSQGFSYPKALEIATKTLLNLEFDEFFLSNNILALEYIKSTIRTNSSLKFIPITRVGSNYLTEKIENNTQPSATAIRKYIYNGKLDSISKYLPNSTLESLKSVETSLEYFELIKYVFLVEDKNLKTITGYEEGLENLIVKNLKSSNDFKEFIEKSKSKRYKEGRLKRYILNCILEISKNLVDDSIEHKPKFVNVLGFNNKGASILKDISKVSDISLIVNKRDFNLKDSNSKSLFQLENKATDLYNIISGELKSEYQYMPIIQNNK